jgi:hypothetical protein
MKWIPGLALLVAFLGCTSERAAPPADSRHDQADPDPHAGHAMGHAQAVLMVSTKPEEVSIGEPVTLEMMIHDDQGAMVKDFEVIHEKKIHLILVRDGLDEFAHLHPELRADGTFWIQHAFPKAGKYRLYVDHKPASQPQATAVGAIEVAGDAPPAPTLVPNVPGRAEGDGLQAEVSADPEGVGETQIAFQVLDDAGEPVADLEPYLGAMGHLVVISADGEQYVHAHPADASTSAPDGKVSFQAHFTKPGLYKGWGQFQRHEQVYTVPFVIEVGSGP